MELDRFAEIVDDMIIQHDYPGFEPRGLRLGLPEEVLRMPSKTFASALEHSNVYVRLAALRWFQERPGVAKSHFKVLCALLNNEDEFVRLETIKTIERLANVSEDALLLIAAHLQDESIAVRKAAAKAIGKLGSRLARKNQTLLDALQAASNDTNPDVRNKVHKAQRQLSA